MTWIKIEWLGVQHRWLQKQKNCVVTCWPLLRGDSTADCHRHADNKEKQVLRCLPNTCFQGMVARP